MIRKVSMPKKNKHRMRAHINPFNELNMPHPKNPEFAQWHLHFPSFFGMVENNKDHMVVNTRKFQIDYENKFENPKKMLPTILDIGCGYGGLMFALTKHFPDNLILGQEIRDKLANFVAKKANTIRINSGYKECMNVGVVRTNTMKTLHNYFERDSVSG